MIDQAGANVRRITPLFADGVQAGSERAGRLLPAGPCGSTIPLSIRSMFSPRYSSIEISFHREFSDLGVRQQHSSIGHINA